MTKYKIGDVIECQVTGLEKYGFFVTTADGYSGLVHISEMSEMFVNNINDYVNVGDHIYSKIIGIDEEKKNLKLSIKNLNYNTDGSSNLISENGFDILSKNLPFWIDEALKKE